MASAQPDSRLLTGLRRLLLLPGSRAPEARRNLRRLLKALPPSSEHVLLLACGQQPDDASLRTLMEPLGYQSTTIPAGSEADAAWRGPGGLLLLGRGRFETWGPWAELGLACAGTATEQLVGLGCPALSLPGQGPQFKRGFAERQSRLLAGPCGCARAPMRWRWGAALAQRATTARRTRADWAPPHGASRRQPGQRPSDSAHLCLRPLRRGAQRLSRTGSGRDRRNTGMQRKQRCAKLQRSSRTSICSRRSRAGSKYRTSLAA